MMLKYKFWLIFFQIFFFLSSLASAQLLENMNPEIPKTGTIAGRITTKSGEPLSNGQVTFYMAASGPPPSENYEKIPDGTRILDQDGGFSAELPTGTYYLRALKRLSGEHIGPPQIGDYIYRPLDEKGQPKEFIISTGGVLDLGEVREAVPLERENNRTPAVSTAINGVVADAMGKPVQNAVVVAFVSPVLPGKPIFASERTGKDGKYLLRLAPGTYFLRVRSGFSSGRPEKGQIVGYYGKETQVPVTVKEGEVVKGVNIKAVPFPGRGPEANMNQQNQKFPIPGKGPAVNKNKQKQKVPVNGDGASKRSKSGLRGIYK
jgi:hypothetical protein